MTHDDGCRPHVGFLFEHGAGACLFRLCRWYEPPEGTTCAEWSMIFVWLAPEWRRRGVLSAHWQTFRCLFGDFRLHTPVSEAMGNFMKRAQPCGARVDVIAAARIWLRLAGMGHPCFVRQPGEK
jgi:hypothetical protein